MMLMIISRHERRTCCDSKAIRMRSRNILVAIKHEARAINLLSALVEYHFLMKNWLIFNCTAFEDEGFVLSFVFCRLLVCFFFPFSDSFFFSSDELVRFNVEGGRELEILPTMPLLRQLSMCSLSCSLLIKVKFFWHTGQTTVSEEAVEV